MPRYIKGISKKKPSNGYKGCSFCGIVGSARRTIRFSSVMYVSPGDTIRVRNEDGSYTSFNVTKIQSGYEIEVTCPGER